MDDILLRALAILTLAITALPGHAQQPFFTDNADVANYHRWHLEANNDFDLLPHSSYPSLRQDTQTIKFSFGAFKNCELGMDFPLITIFNSAGSGLISPFGLGDTDYSVKYNFLHEKQRSNWPAIAASLNIEPATGSAKLGLGSGLIDYYLNGIVQKKLSSRNTLRVNAGATFAGNTLTGAVGIRTRGTVFTAGSSITRQFAPNLDFGIEVYGGHTVNAKLPREALQEQIGGNYQLRKSLSVDFGIIAGQAVGSPRYGAQLGFSKDF